MKRSGLLCLGVLVFLMSMAYGSQVVPAAISPGSERGVALVGQICPTFSWTAVDWASGYRVAVFQAFGVQIPSYEEMAAGGVPVLNKEIQGRASSWTPSSEEQLSSGSLYVWYVQAADSSGQGTWSKGKLFMVEIGVMASLAEARVKKTLREKGVREDVITDVLKEMKTEGPGVIAGRADSKLQGKVGTQGYEGDANTFYGQGAGFSITSGSYNTFVGRNAGYSNTDGLYNTFIGYYAGYANTTGKYNNFIGLYAGRYNTTGISNSFIGYYAGYANTTGNSNNFIGYFAGYSNTTGNQNTFLGHGAGYFNTTGYENTFIGYFAGYSNTTGYNSTFLGLSAGYANTTGNSNTFLGNYSGYSNTTGNSNTFLGYYAGYTNTTGYSNTFLGNAAGFYNSTGTGNIFIGNAAGLYVTGSNKLYIANSATSAPLIYGEFDNGILAVNGKFGVGTQTPTYPMELKTTGRNATFVLQRTDGGAINFVNATPAYGQFGTGNDYPVRILVNSTWRMSLNTDNSLAMINGASCTAGGVWTNASSRELKENIEGLTVEEAAEVLAKLDPVKYNYKADKEERHVGFIAEDVPTLVASKDRKSLSPMDITGVLTKVVQEQAKMVKELQKAIQEQQKTISDYQQIISELKERVGKLEKKGKQ
jgi:hypothetical protein